MARKITVSLNGKVIGKRTTDRVYTHALVLIDFAPTMHRAHVACTAHRRCQKRHQ